MSALKSDYIGFSYNGVHSSDLGIMRTSNGSRFEEDLLPTIKDKTVEVPGGDGTYYFGSYYTQRQFNVSFAFDNLTEAQITRLQELFGDKKIHPLVFDERPYKTYYAKVTNKATIKYIAFDESSKGKEFVRVYKGEGNIQFTCYQPYAICDKKYLKDYLIADYPNKGEWGTASGMLSSKGDYDTYNVVENPDGSDYSHTAAMKLYNPGSVPTDWRLHLLVKNKVFPKCEIILDGQSLVFGGAGAKTHKMPNIEKDYDQKIIFDSKTGLLEGYGIDKVTGKFVKTGNLYNEFLISGDFTKIPIIKERDKEFLLKVLHNNTDKLDHLNSDTLFEYNYLYY